MRVLLVAWGFPPSRASGVHRAVAITRWLAAAGHQVTALTADRRYFEISTGVDIALESSLPAAVSAARVNFPNIEDPVVNRWPRERATHRKKWFAEQERAIREVFPEKFYGGWRDRLVGTAHRLHRQSPYDLVIATGNPYVGFAVAEALNTHDGVPFLMDDRDSFLYSVYTGQLKRQSSSIRQWWETLAARALEVWYVNPPIAALYRDAYPTLASKIHIVENGWDADYLNPTSLAATSWPGPVFGYVGTLNAMFPLEPMLDGWARARANGIPDTGELRIFGGLGYRHQPEKQRELLRKAEAVSIAGSVPKTEIASAYEQCDALVFSREGGALVTSSKIYEYMATGLPVAAVMPADHDSRRVLAGYPRAHIADLDDVDGWPRVLLAAHQDARQSTPERVQRAQDWGIQYRRDQILSPALQRVCDQVGKSESH